MSDYLYSTRLRYTEIARGVAKLHGVAVPIIEPPRICGALVAEIDYTPEVRCYRIRSQHGGWRDMTSDEVASADRYLAEVVRVQ